MPVLPNTRHERFAQEIAKGTSIEKSYVIAGYKANRGNAARLNSDEWVRARVRELMEAGARRTEVTVEGIVRELAKIGFGDIRRAVRWGDAIAVRDKDGNETIVAGVALLPSEEIDDATAAAIAEVAQTRDGLRVKFHDKRAALADLGKHLGMFIEQHEVSGPNKAPLKLMTAEGAMELARGVAAIFAEADAREQIKLLNPHIKGL